MEIQGISLDAQKAKKYEYAYKIIEDWCNDESDKVARMANTSALLKDVFKWWWVGFYCVQGEELVLGPFQGPVACTRIGYGRGVCGTAWKERRTVLVPDVEQFPGHIACSSASKSEIVVPVFKSEEVVAVLDVDSEFLNYFDEEDALYLEKIAQLISR